MMYSSWVPRNWITTIRRGKSDLYILTLIDGKCAALEPVMRYQDALEKAQSFHRDHPCQIKVLPVSGPELRNLLGIMPAEPPEPMDPALRQEMVAALKSVVRDGSDPDARRDAFELLQQWG